MENIADKLQDIFLDCLYKPEEITGDQAPGGCVVIDGIVRKYGLHPARMESHRAEVAEIIEEMQPEFKHGTGDGQSFLNLCVDRNGVQWGEHLNCEQLVVLAIGLKLGGYCASHREMWKLMPGGMPYVYFK